MVRRQPTTQARPRLGATRRGGLLHVDHDHSTGRLRALICGNCNRALGMIRDHAPTADALAAYLRKHQT
jgi:hypothetical protein